MAFDPLLFSIKIVDDIDSQLKSVKSKLANAFKDVPVTFLASDESVAQLRKQLQGVLQGLNLGKSFIDVSGVAQSISSSYKEIAINEHKATEMANEHAQAVERLNALLEKRKELTNPNTAREKYEIISRENLSLLKQKNEIEKEITNRFTNSKDIFGGKDVFNHYKSNADDYEKEIAKINTLKERYSELHNIIESFNKRSVISALKSKYDILSKIDTSGIPLMDSTRDIFAINSFAKTFTNAIKVFDEYGASTLPLKKVFDGERIDNFLKYVLPTNGILDFKAIKAIDLEIQQRYHDAIELGLSKLKPKLLQEYNTKGQGYNSLTNESASIINRSIKDDLFVNQHANKSSVAKNFDSYEAYIQKLNEIVAKYEEVERKYKQIHAEFMQYKGAIKGNVDTSAIDAEINAQKKKVEELKSVIDKAKQEAQQPKKQAGLDQSLAAAIEKFNAIKDKAVKISIDQESISMIDAIVAKLNALREINMTLKINNLAEVEKALSQINTPTLRLAMPSSESIGQQLQEYLNKLTALQEGLNKPQAGGESAIAKQAWSDVEAFNALLTTIEKAGRALANLDQEKSVYNSGKTSDLYKTFTNLNAAATTALGQTPKVEESSLNEFITLIKTKMGEIETEVKNRGGGLASTFHDQFSIIKDNLRNLMSVGVGSENVAKMQQEMAGIASAFNQHIVSMQAMLSALKEDISNDNFTAFGTRITNCAEAMDKLTAAFQRFQGVIGTDKGMADFMTGLGEVIRNARFQLGQLGEGLDNIGGQGGALDNLKRNSEKIENELYKVQKAYDETLTAIKIGQDAGMKTDAFERHLKLLKEYEDRLIAITNDATQMSQGNGLLGVIGTQSKYLLSSSKGFKEEAEAYRDASIKVSASTIDLESAQKRLTNLISRTASQNLPTQELENMLQTLRDWKSKMDAMPNMTAKAGIATQANADVENAKILIRLQEERNKNQGIYNTLIEEADRRLAAARQTMATSQGLGIDTSAIEAVIKKVEDARNKMASEGLGNLDSTQTMRELSTAYRRLAYEMRDVVRAQNNLNKTQEATNKADAKKWAESARAAAVEQDKLNRKLQEYQDRIQSAKAVGIDTTELERAAGTIQQIIQLLDALKQGKGLARGADTLTTSEFIKMIDVVKAKRDADEISKAVGREIAALKSGKSEAQQWAESQRDAAAKAASLITLMERMKGLRANGQRLQMDTTDLDKAIVKLDEWINKLRQAAAGDKSLGFTKDILRNPAFAEDMASLQNAALPIREQIAAIREQERAKREAGKASKEMTIEEQKLAQAIEQTTQAAKGQSQILSDLKSMAAQYFSVYAAQQFLSKVIEIGGQLENQRLSISAILGDVSHANTLFEQIQSLAVKSPFGVVELDQYTKQLSAFGFKYNELYDMTKRLADISAGAGTDVGRLALALGHVRSEGALTGYTLRQFAMNNIPMLKELSRMLSAREGRVVSTADIRKRVSKKSIGFEDVQQVIKNLTNEGGMFYNMQEVISGSTKSKWKNLKDALDIMYGRMAESGAIGGTLKDTAAMLTNLTKHWQELIAVVGVGTATWGMSRMALMLYNSALGQNATSVYKAMANARKQEILNQEVASSYRTVTAAERANVATKNAQIVTTAKLALNTGKLSAEELSRSVALGVMSKKEAFAAIAQSNLTITTKRQIAAMIRHTQILGKAGRAIISFQMGLTKIGTAISAVFTNPMTWIMAAVGVITELWSKNRAEMERLEEAAKDVYTKGAEGLKNTAKFVAANGIEVVDKNGEPIDVQNDLAVKGASFKFPVYADLDEQSIKSFMENAEQYIREYSATPNKMLNDAFALNPETKEIPTLEQQYNSLAKSVEETAKAQAILKGEVGEMVEYALKSTDGSWWLAQWFNEDLITNINDYSNSIKNYKNQLTELYEENKMRGRTPLLNALIDETFAADVKAINARREANKQAAMTDAETIQMLVENSVKYRKAMSLYSLKSEYGTAYNTKYYATKDNAFKVMEKDLDVFVSKVKTKLEATGWDFTNLTKEQKNALNLMISQVVTKAGDATDAVKKEIIQLTSQKFGIQLDVEEEEAIGKISAMKLKLEELIGKRYVIEFGITGNLGDDLANVDKRYKQAKELVERYGKYLVDNKLIEKTGDYYSESGLNPNLTEEERKEIQERERQRQEARSKYILSKRNNEIIQKEPKGTDQTINAYTEAMNIKIAAEKWYKEHGLEPPEDSKNKGYKGELEKRWDERIRIMKEAYDWYDKWNKEYGKDTALEEVGKRYNDIFDVWRTDPNPQLRFDFDANKVEDYLSYVRQIRQEAMQLYQQQRNDKEKNNGQEALRVVRQATSVLTDFNWDNIQKASDLALSKMTRSITDLTDKWKLFNDVVDATGSRVLAEQLTGVNQSVNATIVNELKSRISKLNAGVDFDKAYAMSNEELKRYISEDLAPLPEAGVSQEEYDAQILRYNENIKATVNLIEEWQKAVKELRTEDVKTYAKIIGSAQDFNTLIQKNNDAYKKQEESLTRLKTSGAITEEQYNRAITAAQTDRDTKNSKLTAAYDNLLNRSASLSRKAFDAEYVKQERLLGNALDKNVISLKEYNEQMAKLQQLRRDFDLNQLTAKGSIGQFLKGGAKGLRQYYEDMRTNRFNELIGQGKTVEQAKNDKLYQLYDRQYNSVNKVINGLEGMSFGLSLVTGALNGFSQAFDAMSQMFDALGNEGAANWFSDASDAVKGVSSIFSPVGDLVKSAMNGDVGGIVSGAISAPFKMIASPITAFSQLHDKKIEREISKLREAVTKIQNNTALLKDMRERTLGYDMGYLRRSIASEYEKLGKGSNGMIEKVVFGDKTAYKDMYEYYSRGGTAGTGYQQEYNNLLKERDNLYTQLNKQESKKKKSKSDIEETKKQIAELNDQIYNFTQDLAKELWDIDIKSWAQQLSDALTNAFENGENAVKSYEETVRSIIQSLTSKMMQLALIEPLMNKLQKQLFGELQADGTYKGGVVDLNNPEGSAQKIADAIGEYFGTDGEGRKAITAAQEYLTAMEKALNDVGLSLMNDSSSTLGNGIQGTSEETSNLLAGYVNALRQDVAINRMMLERFTGEYWENYIGQITGIQSTLNSIDRNVAAIYALINEQGAMYGKIESIDNRIRRLATGQDKLTIN